MHRERVSVVHVYPGLSQINCGYGGRCSVQVDPGRVVSFFSRIKKVDLQCGAVRNTLVSKSAAARPDGLPAVSLDRECKPFYVRIQELEGEVGNKTV